jgi:hypothetical protein
MSKYALLKENVVVKIEDLSSEEEVFEASKTYQLVVNIDNQTVEVGFNLDGNSFTPYEGYVAPAPTMIITKLAFRQRLTVSELLALYNATATNVMLRIIQDNLSVATYVDLSRTDTQSAVMYLVSQGLLTLERATEILTTPAQDKEKYKPLL